MHLLKKHALNKHVCLLTRLYGIKCIQISLTDGDSIIEPDVMVSIGE